MNPARNSESGWLNAKALLAARRDHSVDDVIAWQRVKHRLSLLARVHSGTAEPMQIIRYRPGQHYHYHTDTGGSANIAGRNSGPPPVARVQRSRYM